MATTKKTTETTPVIRREKKDGVLGKVWTKTGSTVENGFDILDTSTKTVANAFRLGNELLIPNILEAREDVLLTLQEATLNLINAGMSAENATEYLRRDIM